MAVRQFNRTTITPLESILPRNLILEQNYVLTNLDHDDQDKTLIWLSKHRLIKNSIFCNDCNKNFCLNKYEDGIDGYRWYCSGCKKRRSVRENSFFSGSHLKLREILVIMYGWAHDIPQGLVCHEAGGMLSRTAVDWFNFCRDVCAQWLDRHEVLIGGFNENGEPIVVEIDESKFFHRKYHRGQWRPGHWVFGGIERISGKCFLVEVPDRKRETLEAMIRQYILPGSHIVSDGWASYRNIENIDNGVYTHDIIVHETNLVDPADETIHTQNVENLWMRVKRKLRRQFGTSEQLFTSYIKEFMWLNNFKEKNPFSTLIVCVTELYNLD